MIDITILRQARIGPFTIFDTVISYIGIWVLSPVLTWLVSRLHLKIPLISWLWFTLPIAVIFHLIFRQTTPLMKILANPESIQFYFAVSTLLAMSYFGFREINKI